VSSELWAVGSERWAGSKGRRLGQVRLGLSPVRRARNHGPCRYQRPPCLP